MSQSATHAVRPDGRLRLPPGQRLTEGWPVLHYGSIPRLDPETWAFPRMGARRRRAQVHLGRVQRPRRDKRHQRHSLRDDLEQVRQRMGGRTLPRALRLHQGKARSEGRDDPQLRGLHDERAPRRPPRGGRALRAKAQRRAAHQGARLADTAGWCPTSTSGRARSGWAACNSSTRTAPVSGKCTATTCTAIPGGSSAYS